MKMIIAGTGHRPPRLGLDYSPSSNKKLTHFASQCLEDLIKQENPEEVTLISGMAQGWDQALAHAAVLMKVPFIAACPFKGQELPWPEAAQARYNSLLSKAVDVVFVRDEYSKQAYIDRDHWMVDRANFLLTLWDGKRKGGTAETVSYALKKTEITIIHTWPEWKGLSTV